MYKSLQSSRAIAAILVVLFHLGANLAKDNYFGMPELSIPFSFGDSGVEFFFVLSGFIIFSAHFNDIGKPYNFLSYVKKRFIRIFPTYWLVFMPVFIVALIVPSMRSGVPHDVLTVVQSLLLIPQDKNIVGGTGAPVIIVAWTLQYEILFYLFFGISILNAQIAAILGSAVVIAYVIGLFFGVDSLPFPASFLAQDYILLFLFGMLVAWVLSRNNTVKIQPKIILIGGASFFLVIAIDVVTGIDFFGHLDTVFYGLASSLIIYGLALEERQGRVYLGSYFPQLLGDASYALYLIHFPLISLLCKIAMFVGLKSMGLFGAIVSFAFIFISCLLVAVLFHLWIERPISQYFRRPKTVAIA